MAKAVKPGFSLQVCILAGGLSSRMGQDKSRLRLGRRTILGYVRAAAKSIKDPCVLRKDMVKNCGPIGGIYTALKQTRAEVVLFLACDMPLVTPALLSLVVDNYTNYHEPVFVTSANGAGFPCILSKACLQILGEQIAAKQLSLHSLANALMAKFLKVRAWQPLLLNVNTPEDWEQARLLIKAGAMARLHDFQKRLRND